MAELQSALKGAAKGINRELVKLFGGDMEAAAKSVEELESKPQLLEAWATRMLRVQAKDRLDSEYLFFRDIVEANLNRDEEKRVKHLNSDWLAAWLDEEKQAIDQIQPFSFGDIPTSMQSVAARGMAMAHLIHTMTHEAESEAS